jgi:hypothetical protein
MTQDTSPVKEDTVPTQFAIFVQAGILVLCMGLPVAQGEETPRQIAPQPTVPPAFVGPGTTPPSAQPNWNRPQPEPGVLPMTPPSVNGRVPAIPEASNQRAINIVTPAPAAPPDNQPPPPLDVDWGDLALFFYISQPSVERRMTKDVLGTARIETVLAFDVQARQEFSPLTIFMGNFYTAQGYQVFSIPLQFEPTPYQWSQGVKARAYVSMPDDPGVRKLGFGTLF